VLFLSEKHSLIDRLAVEADHCQTSTNQEFMPYIKLILPLILFILSSCSGFAQKKTVQDARLVGGPCQGCEAVLDFADKTLSSTDTLPEFTDSEPKLKVTGFYSSIKQIRKEFIPPAEMKEGGSKITDISMAG
jgi:hypothetical protein